MWVIRCTDEQCGQVTYAAQIDELIGQHRDDAGWFLCGLCGKHGYIEKSFALQEGEGQTWAPFLKGAIKLEYPDDTYRPFAFLVGRTADDGEVDSVWVSYYKDLRESGGKLKMGYGPGGPPVLELEQVATLVRTLVGTGLMEQSMLEPQ